jgi:hypothetical protein
VAFSRLRSARPSAPSAAQVFSLSALLIGVSASDVLNQLTVSNRFCLEQLTGD